MEISEREIEERIVGDICLLNDNLVVVGSQIDLGGYGKLDVLAYDMVKDEYVVIEIKNEPATEKAITQTMRYIVGIKDFYPSIKITGLIVAPNIEDNARSALRFVHPHIEYCQIDFEINYENISFSRNKDSKHYESSKEKFHDLIGIFKEMYLIDSENNQEKIKE